MIVIFFAIGLVLGTFLGAITAYTIRLDELNKIEEQLKTAVNYAKELEEAVEWQFAAMFDSRR